MSVAPPFVGQQPQEFELENNCYECATCGGHQKLRLHEDHLEIYETVPCPWWITFCYIPGPFLALALCNLKKTKRVRARARRPGAGAAPLCGGSNAVVRTSVAILESVVCK